MLSGIPHAGTLLDRVSDLHQHFEQFVSEGSQSSFGHLVDGYCGLVFGTALRRMGDTQLAEEVTQDVFTKLAEKAGTIRHPNSLGA